MVNYGISALNIIMLKHFQPVCYYIPFLIKLKGTFSYQGFIFDVKIAWSVAPYNFLSMIELFLNVHNSYTVGRENIIRWPHLL